MHQNICLVFSPIDKEYQDATTHYAPPLGLVALANHLAAACPDVEVTILDGSVVHDIEAICHYIETNRPTLVGQSVQLISYDNSLEIARYARSIGSLNVFGGHHATQLADTIVTNQEGLVDYVVVGDGEEALSGLCTGLDVTLIPNLVFCKNGIVHRTKNMPYNLTKSPILNYAGIDISVYKKLLAQADFDENGQNMTYWRMYSHKGCGNRGNSTGCVFCGRSDRGVRFKKPEQFWKDVCNITQNDKTSYVFDVGDDFLYDHDWVSKVAKSRPKSLKNTVEFGIFGRANRINNEVARLLSLMNVKDMVIGFESGDDEVLKRTNKRFTSSQTNIDAAKFLFSNNIDVCASFVLGLPGESKASLSRTVESAIKIHDIAKSLLGKPPREMVANLIEPSPGSTAFRRVCNAFPDEYTGKDLLSLRKIQRDYFKIMFKLDSDIAVEKHIRYLKSYAKEIHKLVDYSDSQGWLSDELADTTIQKFGGNYAA